MWEWRVFIPNKQDEHAPDLLASSTSENSRAVPDVWSLLDLIPRRRSPEVRTDVYVPCSSRSGVKLRSGKILEVKLRSERHENGAEMWLKVSTYPKCVAFDAILSQ